MSQMTNTAQYGLLQLAILKLRATRKPSGYDMARAYLAQQHHNHFSTEVSISPQLAAQERRGAIRGFHHQAFAAPPGCQGRKRVALFGSTGVDKTRRSLQGLRSTTTEAQPTAATTQSLCDAPAISSRIAATAQRRERFFPLALHLIIAPNIFLLLGNLLLLLPILLPRQSLSEALLLQTAQLIKLSCNYLLPLLCGWKVVIFALKRRISFLWPVAGLLSLACNSCWLVIDARIALIGGSFRVCTNMTSSSWSWFLLYLTATLPLYLLFSKRLQHVMASQCAPLREDRCKQPPLGRKRQQAPDQVPRFNDSESFLANRWHH
ncbi:hypothetical protein [Brucella pituitosa]|uniref:hypothetical protein n=1 Tax=Brucella pituitosa TaxID=571256 RepID=UPI0012602907|nr:hypothetical protein [Brucella pituitosa]